MPHKDLIRNHISRCYAKCWGFRKPQSIVCGFQRNNPETGCERHGDIRTYVCTIDGWPVKVTAAPAATNEVVLLSPIWAAHWCYCFATTQTQTFPRQSFIAKVLQKTEKHRECRGRSWCRCANCVRSKH